MCNVGFYNANASQAVDQSLIHAAITSGNVPISMIADVVDCRACHAGADCSTAGTTAAQLPPAPPPAAPSACGMSVGLGIGLGVGLVVGALLGGGGVACVLKRRASKTTAKAPPLAETTSV